MSSPDQQTLQVEVEVHRTLVDAGVDANGPRKVQAWALLGGRYVIWKQLGRFRWALAGRGKPELRVGIPGHGAGDTLVDAVQACVDNFLLRDHVLSDHGESVPKISGVRVIDTEVPTHHCRECTWQGSLGTYQVLCPSCHSPNLSKGPRPKPQQDAT